MRDSVDRVLDQWRAERPDLDPAPMGVMGRISRAAHLAREERLLSVLEESERDHLAGLLRTLLAGLGDVPRDADGT